MEALLDLIVPIVIADIINNGINRNNEDMNVEDNLLTRLNKARNKIGLPSLKFIWCKICRQLN